MAKTNTNEMLLNIQNIFKEIKDKYSSYENTISSHIKQSEESLEKLGLTEKIVVQNGFKLGVAEYDILLSKYSKSKVSNDENTANSLNSEATKMTKDFLVIYRKHLEDKKTFMSDITKNIESFESDRAFNNFLSQKEQEFNNTKAEVFEFINKKFEEHINSFEELKKYKATYSEIVSIYDITSRKSNNIHTEIHEVFKKSYIA